MELIYALIAGLSFILGFGFGGWAEYRSWYEQVDGVAFIDNGKERFILTTPHSKVKKRGFIIFMVHGDEVHDRVKKQNID